MPSICMTPANLRQILALIMRISRPRCCSAAFFVVSEAICRDLSEWCKKGKHHLNFKLLNDKGNRQDRLYQVVVVIDDVEYGQGSDYSIKGAEQLAAEKTWNLLLEKHLINTEPNQTKEP